MKTKYSLCLLLLLFPLLATSQLLRGVDYRVESGLTFSDGDNTPLYLMSNKQGLSSNENNWGFLRGGLFARGDFGSDSPFSFETGLDIAVAYHLNSDFFMQQFYLDFNYKKLSLSLGSKERYSELKNRELSNGGLTFSGNARPIPQIRLELPDYIVFPGTRKWLHVKGHIAYGRFTDDDWKRDFTTKNIDAIYQKNVLYHSKAAFFKIGKREKFPLEFEIGLEMYCQFGGSIYNHRKGKLYDMPGKFKDYVKAFIPMSGDESTSESEQMNISGNQLGSCHLAASYYLNDWKIKAYYEHYFEDHSQLFGYEIMKNTKGERELIYYGWKDCLTGVEITFPKNKFINTFLYEFLYTKDQSGAGYHDPGSYYPEQMSGIDDYFNHSIYSAWQHYGQAIGNPVIISPIFNDNGFITFQSTRVISHHIGFNGSPTSQLSYRFLFTHTRHWGTYYDPTAKVEQVIDYALKISYSPSQWEGWQFSVEGALDRSKLIGNNIGAQFTIRKVGIINVKQ